MTVAMANPSKRIGTEGENRSVEVWSPIFPAVDIERLGGNRRSHDLTGAPFPIEVKRRKTISLPAWSRDCRDEHGDRWLLHIVPRDRRRKDAVPEMAVLPIEFATALVAHAEATGFFS